MRTTIDLTPEAYHLVKTVSQERKQSMGAVVSEFIVGPILTKSQPSLVLGVSSAGFPTFSGGMRRTNEDVKAMLDEMDELDEK